MDCPSGSWLASHSESLLLSPSIYSLFTYGSSRFLYFSVISSTDGSVSVRYKSSISCSDVFGSIVKEDYIYASAYCSSSYLIILKISNYSFDIKAFPGKLLLGFELDTSTRR